MRVVILVSAMLLVKSLDAFTGGGFGISGVGMCVMAVVWAAALDLSEAYNK